jgi:N-methylhydantoinase B
VRRPRAKEIVRGIERGAVFRQRAGGGGGYGDPRERPVEQVVADVLDGVLSADAAREDYGVVVDPVTLVLDEAATARRRGQA